MLKLKLLLVSIASWHVGASLSFGITIANDVVLSEPVAGTRELRIGQLQTGFTVTDALERRGTQLAVAGILWRVEKGDVLDQMTVLDLPGQMPLVVGEERFVGFGTQFLDENDLARTDHGQHWAGCISDGTTMGCYSYWEVRPTMDHRWVRPLDFGPATGIVVGMVPEPRNSLMGLSALAAGLLIRDRKSRRTD